MSSGTFRQDDTTRVMQVASDNGVHIGFGGGFGGGTVSVNKVIGGVASPLYEGGVAISYTAVDDDNLLLVRGDKLQLVMSGSTSPELTWTVTGAV